MANKPTVSPEVWQKRIRASRRRREAFEPTWAQYARLHTNAYLAVQEGNDSQEVTLPNGDQVKLGLVHANIEQALALVEVPEIGVRATAHDFTRELGREDSHREAVVEQGVHRSLMRSGLIKGPEEVDAIKRDGVICGHGCVYSYWRVVEEEVEGEPVAVLDEVDGVFQQAMDDETGEPLFEYPTETKVIWEGCKDVHVSPLELLFSATAKTFWDSPWHGMEKVTRLDELREDSRYEIPVWVKPSAYKVKDLYGNEVDADEEPEKDSVKVITIYDKANRELLTFIEADAEDEKPKGKAKAKPPLVPLRVDKYAVRFTDPDASPFNLFVPIPAADHPFGISQVEHIRNPGVEADKLRTRMANLTRQLKRIPWYRKGRVDADQLADAYKGPDAVPVGLDLQDEDDPAKLFGELPFPRVHGELFQGIEQARSDVAFVSGTPWVPFSGADTATESENQMTIGGARPNRKRRRYMDFLTTVANVHKDFLRAWAPRGQTMQVTGVDGTLLVLSYGREAFEGDIEIEVVPGGGASAISPVRQKMMVEMGSTFMGRFGPEFDLIFLRQALTMMDARDINALMQAARKGVMGMMPGGAQPGAPAQSINLNDYTNGQAIRAAVNAPNEGSIT